MKSIGLNFYNGGILKSINKLLHISSNDSGLSILPIIKDYLIEYSIKRESEGVSKVSIDSDIYKLHVFLNYTIDFKNNSLDCLKYSDIKEFFDYLEKDRKVSFITINRYVSVLKSFFKIVNLDNFNSCVSEFYKHPTTSDNNFDPLFEDELNLIIDEILKSRSATKIRDATILRFLWDSGCSISEVLRIKYIDCDIQNKQFKIYSSKGAFIRTVVCSENTLESLNFSIKYNINKEPDDVIFQNFKGYPL